MQKISPFLWFDTEAEAAARHYVSIFRNSRVGTVLRYGDAGPGPKGEVMLVSFELDGQSFTALNGGPRVKINDAISFVVDCQTQAEVDHFWDRLSEGGETRQCGWLTDRFGVSWQIVPSLLVRMLDDPDPEKALRVTRAMFAMTRIEIAALQRAYDG